MSQAQLRRDKNALRGLFSRNPGAKTMGDIHLAGGEDLFAAVNSMVTDGELDTYRALGRIYYNPTQHLRPYKPS